MTQLTEYEQRIMGELMEWADETYDYIVASEMSRAEIEKCETIRANVAAREARGEVVEPEDWRDDMLARLAAYERWAARAGFGMG